MHQRRLLFLLSSTNSQRHAAQSLTRSNGPEVSSSVVAGSLIGPRLTGRIGARAAMVSGLLAIAAGLLLLARIAPGGGYFGHLLPSFVLMGAGLGCGLVASTASGTSAVDDEKQGLASGLLNAAAQVGTVLGLAVLIPLSAARTDALAGLPLGTALVAGFRWTFFGAAGLAVLGALLALLLVWRASRSGLRSR